jgi:hypothetical protein
MRMTRAWILCGCLAALPLAACTGSAGITSETQPPAAIAGNVLPDGGPRPAAYAGPAAPAAVLVFLPDAGFGRGFGSFGELASVPLALWTEHGLGVVMPRLDRAVLAEERGIERLLAYARAMTTAPIWLVGPSPDIEWALERLPRAGGQVSGVVVTSVASPAGSCSQTVVYSSPGNGAAPTVQVRTTGNACDGVSPSVRPPVFEPMPEPGSPPKLPGTILVHNDRHSAAAIAENSSAAGSRQGKERLVRQIADQIKQSPPS